jgi:hypothetical protein
VRSVVLSNHHTVGFYFYKIIFIYNTPSLLASRRQSRGTILPRRVTPPGVASALVHAGLYYIIRSSLQEASHASVARGEHVAKIGKRRRCILRRILVALRPTPHLGLFAVIVTSRRCRVLPPTRHVHKNACPKGKILIGWVSIVEASSAKVSTRW